MAELYSKAEDCKRMANYLYNKLSGKIDFRGSTYQEVIYGKYRCAPYSSYSDYEKYKKDELSFYYKFLEGGFLRITIENGIGEKTMGHKLAALSDMYLAISEIYGSPTIFYTLKDDEDGTINLQWSFTHKDEDIKEFKEGTMFDDAEIDKLVIIGESAEINSLSDKTRSYITSQIGLPVELIYILDENIEEFLRYKQGIAIASTKQSEPVLCK